MKRPFTIEDIRNSAVAHLNPHILDAGKPKPKTVKKLSRQKEWLTKELKDWGIINSLVLETEYRFFEPRKWRFDWAYPQRMIAVEYEGIFSKKSRHTTITGFTGDTDKYSKAAVMGWKVVRVTALNYKNVIELLEEAKN